MSSQASFLSDLCSLWTLLREGMVPEPFLPVTIRNGILPFLSGNLFTCNVKSSCKCTRQHHGLPFLMGSLILLLLKIGRVFFLSPNLSAVMICFPFYFNNPPFFLSHRRPPHFSVDLPTDTYSQIIIPSDSYRPWDHPFFNMCSSVNHWPSRTNTFFGLSPPENLCFPLSTQTNIFLSKSPFPPYFSAKRALGRSNRERVSLFSITKPTVSYHAPVHLATSPSNFLARYRIPPFSPLVLSKNSIEFLGYSFSAGCSQALSFLVLFVPFSRRQYPLWIN